MPAKEPHQGIPNLISSNLSKTLPRALSGIFHDSAISHRAKGILVGLLYGDLHPNLSHITNASTEGITSVRSAIAELEEWGYLVRVRYRDRHTKRYCGSVWICGTSPEETDQLFLHCMDLLNKNGLELVE